jgi:hypothetical protein
MRMADLRKQLTAETNGTVVEAMVVEQAISTWLQLCYHENREATRPAESIQLGEFRLKKIEASFNRHMRSLGALSALSQVAGKVQPAELSPQVDSMHSLEKLNSWPAAEMKLTSNRVNQVLDKDAECLSLN